MSCNAFAPLANRRLLRLIAVSAPLALHGCSIAADDHDDRGPAYVDSRASASGGARVVEHRDDVPAREPDPTFVAPALAPSYLIVDWTIDGSKDPFECRQGDVSDIEIVISDSTSGLDETFTEACESFALEIELAPGDYSGEASLLTPSGEYGTNPVDLGPIATFEGEDAEVLINFPLDSFL